MLEDAQNIVKYKMVDSLMYNIEVKSKIKQMLSIDKDESVNQVNVDDMAGDNSTSII